MADSTRMPAVPKAALQQGGVFTAEQARSEGWTPRTIRRRIVAGRWVYVAGRALAEPRPGWTAFQLAVAAQLSLHDVVISHRTAAGLHGFPNPNLEAAGECDVIIDRHREAGHRIRAHLLRLEATEIQGGPRGIRLTTAARTALDCLAAFEFGPALDLWAWVTTRQILDRHRLLEAIEQRRSWHGTPQLKRIAVLGAAGALSQAEVRLHALLRRAGITDWKANTPVRDASGSIAVPDLLFEEARLIVEVDGWRAHSSPAAFICDRRRDNLLVAAGYQVLHFT